MTNLNDLALLLSDLLDQLMNSSSSSGGGMSMEQMIQQLQQMAAQQEQLNQALEELFGRQPGERLTPDMQERLQTDRWTAGSDATPTDRDGTGA